MTREGAVEKAEGLLVGAEGQAFPRNNLLGALVDGMKAPNAGDPGMTIGAAVSKDVARLGRTVIAFIPEDVLKNRGKEEVAEGAFRIMRAAVVDALKDHVPEPVPIPGVGLFAEYKHLSEQEIEQFWLQGVNLDDWDYMVLVEPGSVWSHPEKLPEQIRGIEGDMLLHGCSHNKWYENVIWRGAFYDVGVAYHS